MGQRNIRLISDLWMEGDTLVIYSRNQRTVMRYDLEGDFISLKGCQIERVLILRYNDGYAMEMNYYPLNDTSYFRYASLDKDQ